MSRPKIVFTKTCPFCKKCFIAKVKRQKYCSRSCQGRGGWKFGTNKPKKRLGTNKICPICNQSFYIPSYRSKKAKYCSRNCLAKDLLPKYIKIYGFHKQHKPPRKYKYIMDGRGKQVREHRYIMEKHLNRKLFKDEHVHHINGNPQDNRLENLVVLSNSDHQKEEFKHRI